jgi:flagellar motility protein MotE (MotC chaperone)
MIRFIRDLRLIPIALIASACLLALKTADLVLESPYFFSANSGRTDDGDVSIVHETPGMVLSQASSGSWAKQMFNFPDGGKATQNQNLPRIASRRPGGPAVTDRDNLDITGSVNETPAGQAKSDAKPDANAQPDGKPDGKSGAAASAKPEPVEPPPSPQGTIIPTEGPIPTGAERAILERLQQRREDLDTRARELEMRESLIQSAEKRIDTHLNELKDIETQIKTETEQNNEAEGARLKALITMYENMKPRDAAKIFNGLEDGVLVEVAAKINPRTMADIMAQMQPDVAQRLTVELATRSQTVAPAGASPDDLPKINGQPMGK